MLIVRNGKSFTLYTICIYCMVSEVAFRDFYRAGQIWDKILHETEELFSWKRNALHFMNYQSQNIVTTSLKWPLDKRPSLKDVGCFMLIVRNGKSFGLQYIRSAFSIDKFSSFLYGLRGRLSRFLPGWSKLRQNTSWNRSYSLEKETLYISWITSPKYSNNFSKLTTWSATFVNRWLLHANRK